MSISYGKFYKIYIIFLPNMINKTLKAINLAETNFILYYAILHNFYLLISKNTLY